MSNFFGILFLFVLWSFMKKGIMVKSF
jgi:hypothetical protein